MWHSMLQSYLELHLMSPRHCLLHHICSFDGRSYGKRYGRTHIKPDKTGWKFSGLLKSNGSCFLFDQRQDYCLAGRVRMRYYNLNIVYVTRIFYLRDVGTMGWQCSQLKTATRFDVHISINFDIINIILSKLAILWEISIQQRDTSLVVIFPMLDIRMLVSV